MCPVVDDGHEVWLVEAARDGAFALEAPPGYRVDVRVQDLECDLEAFVPGAEDRRRWQLLVPGGHEIVGETLVNASDGRVLCHESGGTAHVEWNTADLGIYAHAYGPSLAPLLRWWETSAGPVT